MTVLINRSIPLSKESRDAWRNANAIVLSRRPLKRDSQLSAIPQEERVVVNLGIADDISGNVRFNSRRSVRSVLTPAAIRRTLPELVPPWPYDGQDFWFKGPGQHGDNKLFVDKEQDFKQPPEAWPLGWDAQVHVAGTEYRVITVGPVVVQAHRKTRDDSKRGFLWEWVGVQGIRKGGIIPLVKKAVEAVPDGDFTVIGWDLIVGEDRPYIIEANSSPGVNDATAERIVSAISNR